MKFIKAYFKYFLATVSLFAVTHQYSYGDGFPVRPKRLILNPSVSYFFANQAWDSLRVKHPFPANGKFTSLTYALSAEYGLSRRWTLVGQLPYTMSTYQDNNGKTSANGLTDLETGIRYYIANIDYRYYFMITGTAITPLYKNPSLGYAQSGAELKLSFAGSGHIFGLGDFFQLENAVRQYFGSQGPEQDRYNATFGMALDGRFKNQLSITYSGFYSTSSFTKLQLNPAINKNFAFNQVSLSYGHTFGRAVSAFITGGTFINGRNTGDGSSVSFSLVIKAFR